MTTHMSLRLAWHMDGWNGCICKNPTANVYCVGPHSYPREMIAERRDLQYEQAYAGSCCTRLDRIPPCVYSINAFGIKEIKAFSDPPHFFRDQTMRAQWPLPPATVCIWPYEWMYRKEVETDSGGYDYEQRLENAKKYFAQFEKDRSLIFYYSNYSNPINQGEERRYVVVGMSRIKRIGDIRFYENCSERVRKRYAGGFIWQCDVTSHYPDQGLRLPYHLYLDEPEVLDRFAFFPENPRLFKYATREITDDDALELVERFLEIAGTLQDLGDRSEDWSARIRWLQSLIGELWDSRGLYPGMPRVLDVLRFEAAIPFWKKKVQDGEEKEAKDAIAAFLDGRVEIIPDLKIDQRQVQSVRRQWKLRNEDEKKLLLDVMPRFALEMDQIERILSNTRAANGIYSSLADITANPYILSEEFVGDNPDDFISFNKIDHGMIPSPDLGGEPLAEPDDWRRLRALCTERLRHEDKHTFISVEQLVHDINHKLSFLPDWKRHQFTERYLEVDEENLSNSLVFKEYEGKRYVYLRVLFEDEREIEAQLKSLASRPNITLKSPVTFGHWQSFLTDSNSILFKKNPEEYRKAIDQQAQICQKIFLRPFSVMCGAAGTGKTTVIRAIIKAIEKAHGEGTSFQLLAPTGKAADRLREVTEKRASTIHSFLAKLGWLNENFTFKRAGGQMEDRIQTLIIDEASMVDLELAATLFRAINWRCVQRLILVGDPNQLPPVGRGKIFAEIIDWIQTEQPESLAKLQINMRQMENRIANRGKGVLDLADLYLRENLRDVDHEAPKATVENMLKRVQEGGDIDKDLRVFYWKNPEDLAEKLIERIVADMEHDTKKKFNPDRPWEMWREAHKDKSIEDYPRQWPEYLQVISPYRSELFGTEHLNVEIQRHIHRLQNIRESWSPTALEGIRLFDKVIQFRNRTQSDPIYAYNVSTGDVDPIEVFNGELGFVKPHGFDKNEWKKPDFRLERFQVVYARKEGYWVGYGRKLGKNRNGKWMRPQAVEENLELAYAISVHKSQGSEFERVYFIVPKHKTALLSPELFYTGLTRTVRHCTLLIEEDISPLLEMRRRIKSQLLRVNSSLFEFKPFPDELLRLSSRYEEGMIYHTLAGFMVRSKSEVIIANMLSEREVPFKYEEPRYAEDGTFYLPDFTIIWNGEDWFWEHWGLMQAEEYRNHAETKRKWYAKYYPGRLVETFESPDLSDQADAIIKRFFN